MPDSLLFIQLNIHGVCWQETCNLKKYKHPAMKTKKNLSENTKKSSSSNAKADKSIADDKKPGDKKNKYPVLDTGADQVKNQEEYIDSENTLKPLPKSKSKK